MKGKRYTEEQIIKMLREAEAGSSVAYWYQTEPHKDFAPMLPVELRLPNP